MADSNRIAGVASVTIDGKSHSIAGSGTYVLSSASREPLIGQDGYHGYKEMPAVGKISWQGRDSGAVSIGTLGNAVDATVVLSLANGKTIIGRNMTRTGDPLTVNTEDATFEVEFTGPDVMEA
jgi:hypothetical protein